MKKEELDAPLLLSYLDSNQDKLIQSQMCYRYTIGQSVMLFLKSGCKSTNFFRIDKKKLIRKTKMGSGKL